MLLNDPRLHFARDLIRHWHLVRGHELVPLDGDLDPRELVPCLKHLAIANLAPQKVIFDLAGATMTGRFGRELRLRHVNWIDLVPPILGAAGEHARERICNVPCGYYHRFTATRESMRAVTVETLALPLRRHGGSAPDAVIAFSCEDYAGASIPPTGWLVPSAHVIYFISDLVDIGAGAV